MQRLANATVVMNSCTMLFSTEVGSGRVKSIIENDWIFVTSDVIQDKVVNRLNGESLFVE